jgi:hypothetical protein
MLYLLTSICFATAAIGAVVTAYRTMMALRAKHRAHLMLIREALYDEELRDLYEAAERDALTDQEIKNAIEKIAMIILKMPREDQKFLEDGIHQKNPSAAKRFAKNVLLAA